MGTSTPLDVCQGGLGRGYVICVPARYKAPPIIKAEKYDCSMLSHLMTYRPNTLLSFTCVTQKDMGHSQYKGLVCKARGQKAWRGALTCKVYLPSHIEYIMGTF